MVPREAEAAAELRRTPPIPFVAVPALPYHPVSGNLMLPLPLTPAQRDLVSSGAAQIMLGRLVARYAARFGAVVSAGALHGAAGLGLAEAARTFDPQRGIAFEHFAWSRVRGAIETVVGRELDVHTRAREAGYLFTELARDESDPWGDSDADNRARLAAFSDALVGSFFLGAMSEGSWLVAAEPEPRLRAREARARALAALDRALAAASSRDATLLQMVYFEERSLAEAAATLGISYSSARRAHVEALLRLAARVRRTGLQGSPPAR